MTQYEKFFQLHHQDRPLIIANAWNVKSAQIIEKCGYDAIATSSGAISSSMGYADGEKMPFEEILYIIKRIKVATASPLSVDLERGYTDREEELLLIVQRLIDLGVVGINIEDAQGEEIYLKKIAAIKRFLSETKQQLFLNARTDAFILKLDEPLEITLKRAKLYEAAGADGLFVTGVQDIDIIKTISNATTLPLNIVATPKLSSIEAIAQCGVRRISMAVNLYRATYNHMETVAKDVIARQSFTPLF